TQTAEVFKLRGRGMPDPRQRDGRGRRGDLLVQANIEVPKHLSPREKELLRELAEVEHANVSASRKSFFDKVKDFFVAGDTAKAEDA
ncbi:MAG TPA: hypothetical protein VNQ74_15335, partial [Burkholderiaceae bacterium]|nr:hypothetical protein [Burkholderiaceae bacterium]